jgi:ribosomal protein L7/L12
MSTQHRLPADAREALARGDVIEAIRRVRAATGLGLKEAKDLVDAFARTQGTSTAHASDPHGALNANHGEFVVPSAAATALQQGNLIEAIKLIRDANRMGLKEAKDAVDQLRTRASPVATSHAHPRKMPTVQQGDRGLGGWMLLVAVVVVAFAGWLLSL